MKSKRLVLAAVAMAALAAPLAAEMAPLDLDAAIEAQSRLIEQNPGNASLYNDLGNLLYSDDRPAAAQDAYRQALELDPSMVSVRYNLALLLHQSGRTRRAEREYRKVVKESPEHAWAHYQLGVLLADRGRRGPAIKSFARSMRLDPRLTDPAFNAHIVENSLASSAILRAYADLSSAALSPRVYENPEAVTTILLAVQAGQGAPEKKIGKKLRRERRQQRREERREAAESEESDN